MNQIIFIRWWEAFYTEEQFYESFKKKKYNPYKIKQKWRDWISWSLSENFETLKPDMPNKRNAKYKAWKIRFEKLFSYLTDDKIIIVWNSLWWTFLAKYLSENDFPKNIDQLHLVAPAFDDEWLVDEYIWDFALDETKVADIEEKAEKVFLYFSEDDPIIPFKQHYNYKKLLKNSEFFIFKDRLHFSQPSFPELLENINKNLL